ARVALYQFLDFIGGQDAFLVAHNADFDRGFIESESARHQVPTPGNPYLCTLDLSRRHLPGLRSYKLDAVATHLGIRAPDQLHRALADSQLVQAVLVRLFARLSPQQIVFELQRACPGWSPPVATWRQAEPVSLSSSPREPLVGAVVSPMDEIDERYDQAFAA